MKPSELKRFAALYGRHLKLLKLQGKSDSTISAYFRAVRRIRNHYDCCPDKLTKEQLENYFVDLVESHSWSTVKIDRIGLMFFWKFVLNLDWQWLNIIKPPKIKTIPDILTPTEIERLIGATKKMYYRVFLLTIYIQWGFAWKKRYPYKLVILMQVASLSIYDVATVVTTSLIGIPMRTAVESQKDMVRKI